MVPTIRTEASTENVPMGDNPLPAVTNRFPQVGETTQAPEVVFDLTQGDEGVEIPLLK